MYTRTRTRLSKSSYSPALEHAIDAWFLVTRPQEVEIRAHSLYTTALLREEINKIRLPNQQVIIPQVNERLWTHYHMRMLSHDCTSILQIVFSIDEVAAENEYTS